MKFVLGVILLAGCGANPGTKPTPAEPAGPPGRVEGVVRGPDGALANVFVCLAAGQPAKPPADKEVSVVMGRDGDARPRVTVIRAGQTLSIRNDGPAHGMISIEPLRNRRQIFSLAPGSGFGGMPFERTEFAIPIRCSDHPDGHGWLHVTEHPFFAVTDAEGRYAIHGLPAGDHELFAWHESAPSAPERRTARVAPGGTATLDFTFKAPSK